MVGGVTTRGTSTGSNRSDVDATVARWAAAAGVPASVAQGYRPTTPAWLRFLRGVLAGCAVGVVLLVVGSVEGPPGGVGLALAVLVVWTASRILQRRQHRRS